MIRAMTCGLVTFVLVHLIAAYLLWMAGVDFSGPRTFDHGAGAFVVLLIAFLLGFAAYNEQRNKDQE